MADKATLKTWVVDALEARGGEATILEIARFIWDEHETDLRKSGDLFYTWQYDLRWAGTKLRKDGVLEQKRDRSPGPWRLA